nr:hypothetical protein CFP56_19297 [Quercus suber]
MVVPHGLRFAPVFMYPRTPEGRHKKHPRFMLASPPFPRGSSPAARRARDAGAAAQLAARAHQVGAALQPLQVGARAAGAAAPAPAPHLLGIPGRQAADAGQEVEHVRQADDAREPTGHAGPRQLRGADADARVCARVRRAQGGLVADGAVAGVRLGGGRRGEGRHRVAAVDAGARGHAAGRGGGVDDPHAVGAGGAEFGDGVREGAEGGDVEDGLDESSGMEAVSVSNWTHTRVSTRADPRVGGPSDRTCGTHPDVDVTDVPHHVPLLIDHGQGGDALVVHQLQRLGQRLVPVDGQDLLGAQAGVAQRAGVEALGGGEVLVVLPEEADEAQLRQHADGLAGALLGDDEAVQAAAQDLHGLQQGGGVGEEGGLLAGAEVLAQVAEGDGGAAAGAVGELGGLGVGLGQAEDKQQVGVEVGEVEDADGGLGVARGAQEDDVGGAGADEQLGGVLDAGVELDEAGLGGIDDLVELDGAPVAALEAQFAAIGLAGGVHEELGEGLAGEGLGAGGAGRGGIGAGGVDEAGTFGGGGAGGGGGEGEVLAREDDRMVEVPDRDWETDDCRSPPAADLTSARDGRGVEVDERRRRMTVPYSMYTNLPTGQCLTYLYTTVRYCTYLTLPSCAKSFRWPEATVGIITLCRPEATTPPHHESGGHGARGNLGRLTREDDDDEDANGPGPPAQSAAAVMLQPGIASPHGAADQQPAPDGGRSVCSTVLWTGAKVNDTVCLYSRAA